MENNESKSEKFLLVPTEGFNEEPRKIDLPIKIIPQQKFQNNTEKKRFQNFLINLDKANIHKNKDGLLNIENKTTDINFDDFVNDCCHGNFSLCYENVYCSLRQNGITF